MPLVEARVEFALVQRSATHVGRGGQVSQGWSTGPAHPGVPPIPGSTLKGCVRRVSEQLARALYLPVCAEPAACRLGFDCSVCGIFGNPRLEAPLAWSDALPHPAVAPLLARAELIEARGRMPLHRLTGTGAEATEGNIVATAGGMVYAGVIDGWLPSGEHHEKCLPQRVLLLLASLRATTALGSGKSVGLGGCTFEIESVRLGSLALPGEEALAQLERLGITEGA